eukprot:GFYU01009222.1.p1 GENE.GFYU01009222.1~~GFYU01009222.1.p1  ORF type:complete len:336 (+),score=55.76 GFYU01009222.1:205-1212(+)
MNFDLGSRRHVICASTRTTSLSLWSRSGLGLVCAIELDVDSGDFSNHPTQRQRHKEHLHPGHDDVNACSNTIVQRYLFLYETVEPEPGRPHCQRRTAAGANEIVSKVDQTLCFYPMKYMKFFAKHEFDHAEHFHDPIYVHKHPKRQLLEEIRTRINDFNRCPVGDFDFCLWRPLHYFYKGESSYPLDGESPEEQADSRLQMWQYVQEHVQLVSTTYRDILNEYLQSVKGKFDVGAVTPRQRRYFQEYFDKSDEVQPLDAPVVPCLLDGYCLEGFSPYVRALASKTQLYKMYKALSVHDDEAVNPILKRRRILGDRSLIIMQAVMQMQFSAGPDLG